MQVFGRAADSAVMRTRVRRVRLHGTYVSEQLEQRLKSYCAATHTTESAVIAAALEQYLTGTSELGLLVRRLDRLDRLLQRIQRDAGFYGEAFALWLKVYYTYTPQLPDAQKPFARASANHRYGQFVAELARRLGGGSTLIDELVTDEVGDPAELEKASVESDDNRSRRGAQSTT
jgi:hypothetical protein